MSIFASFAKLPMAVKIGLPVAGLGGAYLLSKGGLHLPGGSTAAAVAAPTGNFTENVTTKNTITNTTVHRGHHRHHQGHSPVLGPIIGLSPWDWGHETHHLPRPTHNYGKSPGYYSGIIAGLRKQQANARGYMKIAKKTRNIKWQHSLLASEKVHSGQIKQAQLHRKQAEKRYGASGREARKKAGGKI